MAGKRGRMSEDTSKVSYHLGVGLRKKEEK
jgi:hypothetical protein